MIYLCVPAHNEAQTVGVVLWKIRQVMADLERDYQLLVADDASTDHTQDVLEPYTRVLPLTVFCSTERRGYAASLEMLLREAVARSDYPRRDTVITLQADFTDEPGHVETLVKRIESGADIVATNARPARHAPLRERWRMPLLNGLIQRLGWPDEVRDPLNGFNAFRVFCIKRVLAERNGTRLVRFEGRAANAQLLHDAAAYARRVDVVELESKPERRQRRSRSVFLTELSQALGLRRRKEAEDLLPVARLAPDRVVSGSSSRRSRLDGSSQRDDAISARATGSRGRRARGRGKRRGTGNGPAATPAPAGTPANAEAGNGSNAVTRTEAGGDTATTGEVVTRRHRSRRGGRRRRASGKPQGGDQPAPADASRVDSGPPLERTTPGAS